MSRNKISAVENLIDEFRKLPGIGPKSAKRIVYFLLKKSGEDIENFSRALTDLKDKVKFCSECFNISEDDRCPICSDLSRNTKIICIVAVSYTHLDVYKRQAVSRPKVIYLLTPYLSDIIPKKGCVMLLEI